MSDRIGDYKSKKLDNKYIELQLEIEETKRRIKQACEDKNYSYLDKLTKEVSRKRNRNKEDFVIIKEKINIDRDQIYFGELVCYSPRYEFVYSLVSKRNILFFSNHWKEGEDIFYVTPKYKICEDFNKAYRYVGYDSDYPQLYIINAVKLYNLLRYFGVPEKLDEEACINLKERFFNGKFPYENCELFGYRPIGYVNRYNKYDLRSYKKFAENDLTPYFQILTRIPYKNSEKSFELLKDECIIRKRILTGKEVK